MHIWLINPFDNLPWEGKAQRYATLAAWLAERGHTVIHWSSGFSHRLKQKREFPDLENSCTLPYQIELVPCPAYEKNVGFARVWNHRCFGRGLISKAIKGVECGKYKQPDIIIASMPPMEGPIAALKLKKRFGCKVILDVMDAWPDTLLQAVSRSSLGGVPNQLGRLALWPYYRMLRRACRESDAVSAQSRAFADFARNHGAAGEIHVCYLGAQREGDCPQSPRGSADIQQREQSEELTSTTASHGSFQATTLNQKPVKLSLLYLGAMGRSYDLETLLTAVEQINREEPKLSLAFVGNGEKQASLEARRVPNVSFTGFLDGEMLDAQLRNADLGIVPFLPKSGVAVPYKAGEYLAYGLPLVCSIDGELGDLLRRYSCGSVYLAENIGDLSRVLLSYVNDPQKLAGEKAAAKTCFNEIFDRTQIYPQFAEWIENVAHGESPLI